MQTLELEKEFLAIKSQLHAYLYRLTSNNEDAEDLVHDTFLKAAVKLASFKQKSSFKTWVFAIATNLARDNHRVKKRWASDALDKCKTATQANPVYENRLINAFRTQPEQQFEIREHINLCFSCISKNLKLEQQIAVVLSEIYQFKRKEISSILNKTEGVVKHLLFEGRKALQEKYEKRCSLINNKGVCYQCAELCEFLDPEQNTIATIKRLGFNCDQTADEQLQHRFDLIKGINPLESNGAKLEDTILQILRESMDA